jgi:hypothetical protein
LDGRTDLPIVPEPLEISTDSVKVKALQQAFDHLGILGFADRPDYVLLQECLRQFTNGETHDESVPKMSSRISQWDSLHLQRNRRGIPPLTNGTLKTLLILWMTEKSGKMQHSS